MPAHGVPSCSHLDVLSFEEIVAFVTKLQSSFDVRKVRLTGGDPLARRGIVDLVASLAERAIPDLALTTNAQQLSTRAAALHAAGLQRLNISLDSLQPEIFRSIARRGTVADTVAGIDAALHVGLRPVKLNMVVMRGLNDHQLCDVLSFSLKRGCELRFLELMPIGYGAKLFEERFVSTATVQEALSAQFRMEPIARTPGSSSRRYRVWHPNGSEGIVGFISPCSEAFCADCTRLRLTADGRLMGCLARDMGLDVRSLLRGRDGGALATAARQALRCKRTDTSFAQRACMVAIGG